MNEDIKHIEFDEVAAAYRNPPSVYNELLTTVEKRLCEINDWISYHVIDYLLFLYYRQDDLSEHPKSKIFGYFIEDLFRKYPRIVQESVDKYEEYLKTEDEITMCLCKKVLDKMFPTGNYNLGEIYETMSLDPNLPDGASKSTMLREWLISNITMQATKPYLVHESNYFIGLCAVKNLIDLDVDVTWCYINFTFALTITAYFSANILVDVNGMKDTLKSLPLSTLDPCHDTLPVCIPEKIMTAYKSLIDLEEKEPRVIDTNSDKIRFIAAIVIAFIIGVLL